MSNFTTVNNWINTHVVNISNASEITKPLLEALQLMADNEVENLRERVFRSMRDYQGQDGMRAIGSLRLNTYDPRLDNYMDNAFAVVLLKSDPHTTDGIFVVIQIVPERYVLKTIIRANKDYVATDVTHTFLSMFDSSLTKPYMLIGSNDGQCQKDIFIAKARHDTGQNIDPQLEPGTNEPFKLTLPDGTQVEP